VQAQHLPVPASAKAWRYSRGRGENFPHWEACRCQASKFMMSDMFVWTPARFLAPAVFVAGLLPFTLVLIISTSQNTHVPQITQLLIKTFFSELITKTNNPIHIHTCDSSC
jgi:hypothetical protein